MSWLEIVCVSFGVLAITIAVERGCKYMDEKLTSIQKSLWAIRDALHRQEERETAEERRALDETAELFASMLRPRESHP